MNLSYWELDVYFRKVDFVVIGGGIVGLSTAYHLKQQHPEAKILLIEKGKLPEGASTKNAGFACFGTLSEVLFYLDYNTKEEVFNLVKRRYFGLKKLRQLIGDENMDYQQLGGYEVFREQDVELKDRCFAKMDEINTWLYPIFNQNIYKISQKPFGFNHIAGTIEIDLEAHIHTGKMMKTFHQKVVEMGVLILNGMEITKIQDFGSNVNLEINGKITMDAQKAFVCTNAFSKQFFDLDIVPARAQVLITKPIANLPVKGCFHMDEGFYYFRNVGDRILFGGARNLDIDGETTLDFGTTKQIQNQLENYLREIIIPGKPFEVEHRWSGIMAMGAKRSPIVKQLSENVFCGVRLTGTGVAIGSLVGEELANLLKF